jgi:dihydrolipoamide dehydrogenase
MRVTIVGGGPAGYEAALVAAQLGAEVVVVDRDGLGGACVLTDCVPSKTLIATAESITTMVASPSLGVRITGDPAISNDTVTADAGHVFNRVKSLATAQSNDIASKIAAAGVRVVQGAGSLLGPRTVKAEPSGEVIESDVILLALGATPRVLPTAVPDGERILDWRHVYDLPALPEHLIVVGSGVTGAEFAHAFGALGSKVTLVSSRDRVLPNEDADAAGVIEEVFARRGIEVMSHARASAVRREGDKVIVECVDGRTVEGSHALMAVGSVSATAGLGLEQAGVAMNESGHILVNKVSRTSVPTIYAAGDCTGVLLLASVAAMQGRIAMWHALGEAVEPIRLGSVAATIFTAPEIATVGATQADVEAGTVFGEVKKLPLSTNARAKMQGITDGFVKVICRPESGKVLGGVVVAPHASELILPLAMAVQLGLTVDQVAHTFSIYPSLSGSVTEAARQLHQH